MNHRQSLEQEDRRNQRISAAITAGVTLLILLISFVWTGFRNYLPPPGEEAYEVVGTVDFGDMKLGSMNINNAQPAVENPVTETPPSRATPQPDPTPPTPARPDPVITQEQPAPVAQPTPTPRPRPQPQPQPKPTPDPTPEPTPAPAPSEQPSESPKPTPTFQPGGSNQGNSETGTGNAGTPMNQVFNDKYSFKPGDGGSTAGMSRGVIRLVDPVYNVQEEGVLTFEFKIRPDGSTSDIQLVGVTPQTALKRAGIDAIRRWKFEPLRSNQPQVNQIVQVEIIFRLRG